MRRTQRRSDNLITNTPEEAQRVLLEAHIAEYHLVSDALWDTITECWTTAKRVINYDKTKWEIYSYKPFKFSSFWVRRSLLGASAVGWRLDGP